MEKEENQNSTATDHSQEVENAEKNINESENKIQPKPEGLSSNEKDEKSQRYPATFFYIVEYPRRVVDLEVELVHL